MNAKLSYMGVWIVVLAVYLFTMAPSMYLGDSGDLAVAAWHLDIAHPTGYPLYALLGRLAMFLPCGDASFRLNLLSLCCAVISVILLYEHLERRGFKLGGQIVALLFAFSPSFWHEALIARVYTLNLLMTLLILRTAVSFPLIACFFIGVGMGNHVMVILALPFLIVMWGKDLAQILRKDLNIWQEKVKEVSFFIFFFLLGFSVYLFLPLRSHYGPGLQDRGDPETIHTFLSVLLRSSYWKNAFVDSFPQLMAAIYDFVVGFGKEFGLISACFIPIGIFDGIRKKKAEALAILLMILGNFALMISHGSHYDLFLTHRYHLTAYLCGSIFLGIGLERCWIILTDKAKRFQIRARYVTLVFSILPLYAFLSHVQSHKNAFFPRDYGINLLAGVPQDTVMIAEGDNEITILGYLTKVERFRTDMTITEGPYLQDLWHRQTLPKALSAFSIAKNSRQALFEHAKSLGFPVYTTTSFKTTLPYGFAYEIGGIHQISERDLIKRYRPNNVPFSNSDPLIVSLLDRYALLYRRLGDEALIANEDLQAQAFYETSLRFSKTKGSVWQNLALSLFRQGQNAHAATILAEGIREQPQNPELYLLQGILLKQSGDLHGARNALDMAQKFAPPDPDFQSRLTMILREVQTP